MPEPTTATDKVTPETPPVTPMLPADPNAHFKQWLEMNNYTYSLDALNNNQYLEGKGFVFTDKPLLVMSIKKKEDNGKV